MAPKVHRPLAQTGGLIRTHSRTSSGGSSNLALNLHFTQKDPAPPKRAEKPKKNGHLYEVRLSDSVGSFLMIRYSSVVFYFQTHARNTSPYPRVNSAVHAHSKEQIHHVSAKHAPHPSNRLNGAKHKAGFTIASPGEDEDEWVSSESGAATPSRDTDDDADEDPTTPVEQVKPVLQHHSKVTEEHPRAQTPVPRVARPPSHEAAAPIRASTTAPATRVLPPIIDTNQAARHQQTQHFDSQISMETRSEIASPSRHSARQSGKRHSITRPPSTHSVVSRSDALRPHPLIRGQSYGLANYAPRPVPLAPLTVTSDTAPAQISSSPPPPLSAHAMAGGKLSTSPSSLKTTPASPSSPDHPALRRTSISSARSVATLPVPSILSQQQPARPVHDRHRTLSTISSSSTSSAALSSLVHLPTISRPPTPQMVSFFPPLNPHVTLEAMHPLLPPPYLPTHMTVLAYRSPVRESFDRVMRAKQAR